MTFCFRMSGVEPVDLEQRIAGVAALDQRLRRDLFRLLVERDDWVTRDEAAAALAVPRSVAAFHLDKLVEAGVLDVRFHRTSGRTGPGAGRPSKLYRPSRDEVAASVPDRRYDLAGAVLADAVADAAATGAPIAACVAAAARHAGEQAGAARGRDATGPAAAVLVAALDAHGYEPVRDAASDLALANCPFHRLADAHRELVCTMNLDFIGGLVHGLDLDGTCTARLDPQPGWCCVRISTP